MVASPPSRFGKGTYILILRLARKRSIRVGRLGKLSFPPGYYAYVGSALGPGGLAARIKHHLKISSKPRWHLDFLRRFARPHEVWVSAEAVRREHAWANSLTRMPAAEPVPGFGCSDCCCPAHLFRFPGPPEFDRFKILHSKHFKTDKHLQKQSLS